MKLRHPDESADPFGCRQCQITFAIKSALIEHCKEKHKGVVTTASPPPAENPEQKTTYAVIDAAANLIQLQNSGDAGGQKYTIVNIDDLPHLSGGDGGQEEGQEETTIVIETDGSGRAKLVDGSQISISSHHHQNLVQQGQQEEEEEDGGQQQTVLLVRLQEDA